MIKKNVTIQNRAGLHARPASIIVQTAQKFECEILIEKEDIKINAKSIMNILTLGAAYNTELIIIADGPDEDVAITEIVQLFDRKFKINE